MNVLLHTGKVRITGNEWCRVQMCWRNPGLLFSKSVETFKKKRWMIGETESGDQSVVNQLIIKTNKRSLATKRKSVQLKVYKRVVKLLNVGLTLLHFLPTVISVMPAVMLVILLVCRLNSPLRTLYFTCFPWSLFTPIMLSNGRQVSQRVTLGSSATHGVDIKSGRSLRRKTKKCFHRC